jgi:hypothetical protein
MTASTPRAGKTLVQFHAEVGYGPFPRERGRGFSNTPSEAHHVHSRYLPQDLDVRSRDRSFARQGTDEAPSRTVFQFGTGPTVSAAVGCVRRSCASGAKPLAVLAR